MIDRSSRNILAEQIRHFLSGLSDNMEFDDKVFAIKSDDVAVVEIRDQLWHIYDDFTRHKLEGRWALSKTDESVIKKFILFLKTDLKCNKLEKSTDRELWPFTSREQLEQAKSKPKYLNKDA